MKKILLLLIFLINSQLAHAKTYYEILGVSRTASADEIKKVHRKLAYKYHPSRGGAATLPEAEKLANEALLKEINDAYDVLKDPQLRAAYDRHWDISSEATRRRNVAEAMERQAKARTDEAAAEAAREEARREDEAKKEADRMKKEAEEEAQEARKKAEEKNKENKTGKKDSSASNAESHEERMRKIFEGYQQELEDLLEGK